MTTVCSIAPTERLKQSSRVTARTSLQLIDSPNLKPTYALIAVDGDPTADIGTEGTGSQNIYVRELGLGLARRGCKVDIFTRREHPDQAEIVENSPGCRTILLAAGPAEFIPRTELFEYLPAFVESWLAFQTKSGAEYALIHSNYWLSGWVGMQLKSLLEIPQVHTFHSIGMVKYKDVEHPPAIATTRHLVERACLATANWTIATSPQEVADLRQFISDRGRIKVIPYGIDLNQFNLVTKAAAREYLKISADERVILYVGRFDRYKGVETLIEACAKLSQSFRLYLVGDSRNGEDCQERRRIQDLVIELNLQDVTVFVGRVPQVDLPCYYAAANVCVIPSYYESFGVVALEAMAAKTPVIASGVGGLKHTVVNGETGLLIPPQDPAGLATAIQSVFDNPMQWQSYGIAGRKWVEANFSSAAVAAQIHNLYRSLTLVELVQESIDNQEISPDLALQIQYLSKLTGIDLSKYPELLERLFKLLETKEIYYG